MYNELVCKAVSTKFCLGKIINSSQPGLFFSASIQNILISNLLEASSFKSRMETPEQLVKSGLTWPLHCLFWTDATHRFGVSIVHFKTSKCWQGSGQLSHPLSL